MTEWRGIDLLADTTWQMTYGERFALEGVLASLRPRLSVEIGTADGGSLRRIAAHSEEVLCFDVDAGVEAVVAPVPNATVRIGDSRETLPAALRELEAAARQVDFALVDGDHSAEGVRRDMEALLASGACLRTVIVIHDTNNDEVRSGLEDLHLLHRPNVGLCFLDLVPGHLVIEDHVYSRQCWNGLGLVILDADRPTGLPVMNIDHEPTPAMLSLAREALARRNDP